MAQGNKYTPLLDYLQRAPQEEITLTFGEIVAVIEDPLPPSARTQRGWWGNRNAGSPQALDKSCYSCKR